MTDEVFSVLRKIAKETGVSLDFLVNCFKGHNGFSSDYLEENEASISGDRSRNLFKNRKSKLVP